MYATILIVDDNAENRTILKFILRRFKYTLLMAENGAEALQIIREKRPDLVLLDWMMPGLSGKDVCIDLRKDAELQDTRIIMVTGKFTKKDEIDAIRFGVDAYISKPIDQESDEVPVKVHQQLRYSMTSKLRENLTNTILEYKRAILYKQFEIIMQHKTNAPLIVKYTNIFKRKSPETELTQLCYSKAREFINEMDNVDTLGHFPFVISNPGSSKEEEVLVLHNLLKFVDIISIEDLMKDFEEQELREVE